MNIFCGAGQIGRKFVRLWMDCSLKADCFIDNNSELWEKEVEGVCVKSFEEMAVQSEDSCYYITCVAVNSMRKQLISLGVKEEQIKDCSIISKMFGCAIQQPGFHVKCTTASPVWGNDFGKILFDLQAGLVLGGVESWSAQTCQYLKGLGWETGFLLSDLPAKKGEEDTGSLGEEDLVSVKFQDNMSEYEKIVCLSNRIVEAGCRNIVVNFIGYNLAAACLVKRNYSDKIRVIAVVHNDEDLYYECYKPFENYIDKYLFISERIRNKMLQSGFPKNKLEYLPWAIACEEKLSHTYTVLGEPLRIGYAGRIQVWQKRLDHIITIAKRLKEMRIDFRLELAGSGSYEEELKQQIKENCLEDKIQFLGLLKPVDISAFWKRQDIMVSCSDWEGHSISQGEAMANGAVPIVTDVSGVTDDITDGKNGFIVDVGSVEQIIEKIVYLYNHRELLSVMGERAHQTILRNNNCKNLENQWRNMLI